MKIYKISKNIINEKTLGKSIISLDTRFYILYVKVLVSFESHDILEGLARSS